MTDIDKDIQREIAHQGSSPPSTIAEAALFYASLGHTVFPAPIGEKKSHKSKKYSNGVNWGATSDLEQIRTDFDRWPNANIGLPTGTQTGFFVIEADTLEGHKVDGIASLAVLQEKNGPLPETRMARSPSGSMHYYFRNPPGIEVKNSSSEIAPGVDVRGEGGMVIAPPSIKPNNGQYEWVNWRPMAEPPVWLVELCRKKEPSKKLNGSNGPTILQAADPELATKGLAAIPNNNLGWEEWNRWGMAIWGATGGSDEGFAAFDRWSKKSNKYSEAETQARWADISNCPPDRIGAGAILRAADVTSSIWREATIEQREEIEGLAALSLLQYDQQRKDVAKTLNIRVDTLDQYVAKVRPRGDDVVKGQGTPMIFLPTEPWPEPAAGEQLVADMEAAIKRHIVLSDEQALATSLWAIHTHAVEFAEHSARLHVCSPAPRCGKTTLLDTVAELVAKPLRTENLSLAVMFRIIEMAQPTLLIDEADAFLKDNEEMRGILNSGHSRGGRYLRIVGDELEPRAFSVWAPVAIAGIGKLAPTIEDRSLTISLRRRLKDEKVERLKRKRPHLSVLGRRAARWVADNRTALADADPELPDALGDREQDNWRALIAIADAISEELGRRARDAALKISEAHRDDESYAIQLLADVAAIFELKRKLRLSSQEILDDLLKLEDRPWPEWRRGQPMTKTSMARLLKPFSVHPKQMRLNPKPAPTVKGYEAEPVLEAKIRYVDNETKLEEGDVAEEPY